MIFDSLKNSALYTSVHPRMKKAFELIATTDWTKMEPGIHELDGRDIYVNVMERELKKRADAERRSVTVVLTEVLRQYLLKDMNEPRPYIPAEARPAFVGDRVRLGALIPSTMFHALNERADSEGRDVSTIITRAILDYLETEVD